MGIKSKIRKFLPEDLLLSYHKILALTASLIYGRPTEKMIIIGLTGTKGKTSTGNFIWSALNNAGLKTGLTGTANFRIGDEEHLNSYHMTMPGPFVLQKMFAKMVKAGCKYCIVETTSDGLKQWRHIGINYDYAVFTNLTPEHLPSHGGSFEKYKETKGRMFAALKNGKHKTIAGKKIDKVIIANTDSPHADYYLNFWADQKITYSLNQASDYQASDIESTNDGVKFKVKDNTYNLNILGGFNTYNALPAVIIGQLAGLTPNQINGGLSQLSLIPGRMEVINEGQNFTLIVDYAHEKESMTHATNTGREIAAKTNGKVIILLGAEGGGRDKNKRPQMGAIVGQKADYVVVSNVDPYEDDPTEIVEDIAKVAEQNGKVRGQDLFVIEDRRAGIAKALSLASSGDVVIITGKGAEQSMIIDGKEIPWDDRDVVRQEVRKLLKK